MTERLFEPIDTDTRLAFQRSVLEDPAINTVGASHFKDGDETEAAAARLVEPRTGGDRMLVLRTLAEADGPLTDFELSVRTGLRWGTAAPRRRDLMLGGWVEDSGMKRPTDTGTLAKAWQLTPRGRIEWNRMKGERT